MNQRGWTRIAAAVLGVAAGVGLFAEGAGAANAKQEKRQLARQRAAERAAATPARSTPATASPSNSTLVDPVGAALAVARAQAEQREREKVNARNAEKFGPATSVAPAPATVSNSVSPAKPATSIAGAVPTSVAIAPTPAMTPAAIASPAVVTVASANLPAKTPAPGAYSPSSSSVEMPPTQVVNLPRVTRSDKARDPQVVAAEIDRLIDVKMAENKVPASPAAEDAEFARRAYVDITGKIPPVSAIESFLRDASPGKRAALVDRLLASPDFGNHLGVIWRELLIPSDTMAKVPNTQPLVDWIATNINSGRGWDQTVRMLLTAEGSIDKSPGAIFFVAHGDNKNYPQADVLTRTVTSAFMGTQLQCAQCHEHPFDKRWKQEDFWGVAAFFGRVENKAAGQKGNASATGATIVESARQAGGGKGKPAAKLGPGDSLIIPPDSFTNVGKAMPAKYPAGATAALGGVPVLRPAFAAWLTDANNPFFAQTMANRMWAQLMGHGIVNPLDDFNPSENQPTHPELLATLSREFAASGFDLKHLVRCVCASKTYGRSAAPVEGNKVDNKWFARVDVKVMSPEVLADSLAVAMEDLALKVEVSRVAGKLKGGGLPAKTPRDHFVRFFKPAGDGIEATDYAYGVPQALLLMNQVAFNAGSPVVDRAMKNSKPQAVEQLYLAALGRKPTPAEVVQAVGFVEKAKTVKEGLSGVMWTLVNRSEFVLNH